MSKPPHAPTHAMVLAAGLGLRMRPITLTTPKPLVMVAGRTMLDRTLDHLAAAGVETAVVNLHHLGEKIRAHLAGRTAPRIVFSDESDALLETGGGVARALPLLGSAPFWVANADVVWMNGAIPALERLAAAFDPARMDALLLLKRTADAHGYDGLGDFHLEPGGLISARRGENRVAPFVFAGVQILSPALFAGCPAGAWSLNRVYDAALAAGRLFGVAHDGPWFHVGTPEAIAPTEALIARAQAGEEDHP